jgi:PAS domain S-box-containing protein
LASCQAAGCGVCGVTTAGFTSPTNRERIATTRVGGSTSRPRSRFISPPTRNLPLARFSAHPPGDFLPRRLESRAILVFRRRALGDATAQKTHPTKGGADVRNPEDSVGRKEWSLHQWAERLKAEAAVYRALPRPPKRFFRERIQRVPVAILLADDSMRYFDANGAACELTGYSLRELTSLELSDLTPPPDRAEARQLWNDFLLARSQSGVFPLCRSDGSIVEVEYSAVANVFPGVHLSALVPIGESEETERPRPRLLRQRLGARRR